MKITQFDKRFSLAAKFNILSIVLILATAIGICLFVIRVEMSAHYQELLNHGKMIADTTAKNCEFGIYTENEDVLLQILKGLSADSDIAYVSVMNRKQTVLASQIFQKMVSLPKHAVPISATATAIVHQDMTDERDGRQYTEVLCPLVSTSSDDITDILLKNTASKHKPAVIGYVLLGMTHKGLQKHIRQLLISITVFTSLLVLVGTGFTVLWSRRITSPLKRLTKATQDIAEGKFDTPFIIRTSDEIVDLAKSFDHMRDRLRAYRSQAEERIAEEQRLLLEKEKLMMDLHDGIGGITTNINILSELARKATGIENIKKMLATITQLSQEGVIEIRSFMQSLDSKELTWQALTAEIRKQGTSLFAPHHIRFCVETSVGDGILDQPGSLLWINMFRIYKEALTNVIKHSRAKTVSVVMHVTVQGLLLTVQDDGIGLKENKNLGRGLPNMKKRVQEMGGRIIISALKKGTRVSLEIPFPVRYSIPVKES